MSCNSCHTCSTPTGISNEVAEKTQRHPCYSMGAHHKYARMHLPIAPKCNISCNYCNRKFDCVNESRPGVTSEVLTPVAAFNKYAVVKEKIENLSVVGIAGPGDALANWPETKETIELIQAAEQDVVFCLSTNGLMLPEYAQEIIELGISHVTVTLNCIDPEIGAKIYKYVSYKGTRYQGVEGAALLLANQLAGIKLLTEQGVLVKINIVMVKGVNDGHIPEVVKKVKELGVFVTNIMPLIPAAGSAFEHYAQTSNKELNAMRNICELELPQMRHCKQCRADAIGLLGEDRSQEFSTKEMQEIPVSTQNKRYRIAVASKYGKMVDLHFGHASEFAIYQSKGQDFELVETRKVQKYCLGIDECDEEDQRKEDIAKSFADCDAVVAMRMGHSAKERLAKKGILGIETCDTVANSLLQTVAQLDQTTLLTVAG